MKKGIVFLLIPAAIFIVLGCSLQGGGGGPSFKQVLKLTASDAEDADYFGWSVGMSGDFTIVGAYGEDGAGSERGAAYIYWRDLGGDDNWGEVKKLTAGDAEDSDCFGSSVAIWGDCVAS